MTRIYLQEHGWINVKEGTTFPINYSVQDVTDITKTNSAYSKQITIVGDKESSKTLGNAFEVNLSNSSFNVNRRVEAVVLQDEVDVFPSGAFFQLLKVNKYAPTTPNADDKVEYIGVVRESISNLFDEIKNNDLDDLQLFNPDEYEVLNKANVKARYSDDYTSLWKYHLTGFGQKGSDITVKQFRPSIFARTYWDAIHNEAGYRWEMDEEADILFNRLVIPYTDTYEPSEDTKRRSRVYGEDTSFYQYTLDPPSFGFQGYTAPPPNGTAQNWFTFDPTRIENNNITEDVFSQWDAVANELTANFTSQYKCSILLDLDIEVENFFASDDVQLWNGGAGNTLTFKIFIRCVKGGLFYDSNQLTITIPEGQLYSPGLTNIATGVFEFIVDAQFYASEDAHFEFVLITESSDLNIDNKFRNLTTGNPATIGFYINTNKTTFNIQPQFEYNVGTPIYMNDFIPKGVKQRDFIKGVLDMYKMVAYPDPSDPQKIIYKTRDKFYDDGEQKDWTDKMAKDKQAVLEWVQDKQKKNLNLTYKEDGDPFNESYQKAIKETYGRYRYTFENEYNKGQEDLNIVFSPTPILFSEDNRNLYVPAIGSMTTEAKKINIRILLDNGVRTDGNFNFLNDDGQGFSAETDYPFAAHWDDPNQPSIDINFGVCRFYFYENYTITFNNLYTLHHQRYVGQLTKGKILTAYFRLTPTDIMSFRLSDKIWVKDAFYNVNKIIDYDANSPKLTKVELITVDEGVEMSFTTPQQPPFRPSPGNPIIADPHTDDYNSETTAMNTFGGNNGGMAVRGQNNTLQRGSQGGAVYGNDNIVNRSKTIIVGDGNTDEYGGKLIVGDGLFSDVFNDMIVRNGKVETLTVEKIRIEGQPFIKTKVLDIGGWDMDTVGAVNINHGLTSTEYENIIAVSVILRNDTLAEVYDASSTNSYSSDVEYNLSTAVVRINRKGGGFFDSTNFDDSTINRGFIKIDYKE